MGKLTLLVFGFALFLSAAVSAAMPFEFNPGCKKGEWDITSTRMENGTAVTRKEKGFCKAGKVRLEVYAPIGDAMQVMIFDSRDLYILDPVNKKAYLYAVDSGEGAIYLGSTFVNLGVKKSQRLFSREEAMNGKVCSVVNYKVLKMYGSLRVISQVSEWADKASGATVRIESDMPASETLFNGVKRTVGPVKEIYSATGIKCRFFMDDGLFTVPKGYVIVDMAKDYSDKVNAFKDTGGKRVLGRKKARAK